MVFRTDIFSEFPSFEFAGLVDQSGQSEPKVGAADRVRDVVRMKP
jgi:hypothetical protein